MDEVAEVIVWDSAVDPTVLQGQVVPWLRAKWGLDAFVKPTPNVAAVAGGPAGTSLADGLVGWLDAADTDTLFRDDDALSVVHPQPNGAIRRWRDKGTVNANPLTVVVETPTAVAVSAWQNVGTDVAYYCANLGLLDAHYGLVWDDENRINGRRVVTGRRAHAYYSDAINPKSLIATGTGSCTRVMVFRRISNEHPRGDPSGEVKPRVGVMRDAPDDT